MHDEKKDQDWLDLLSRLPLVAQVAVDSMAALEMDSKFFMKVCFTDIDGVLVKLQINGKKTRPAVACDEAVAMLNTMTQMTGASIVVTSEWRKHETIARLANCFKKWGVEAEVVGKTPSTWRNSVSIGDRGEEIGLWLACSDEIVEDWVVLDDEFVDLGKHQDRFVKVDGKRGLTWTQVSKAIKLLNMKKEERGVGI